MDGKTSATATGSPEPSEVKDAAVVAETKPVVEETKPAPVEVSKVEDTGGTGLKADEPANVWRPPALPVLPRVFDVVVKGNVKFGTTHYEPGEILAQVALRPESEFGVRFIVDMIEAGRLVVKEQSERS